MPLLSISVLGENTLYFFYCDGNGNFTQIRSDSISCEDEELLTIFERSGKIGLKPKQKIGMSNLVYTYDGQEITKLPVRVVMPWFYAMIGESINSDYSNIYEDGRKISGTVGESRMVSFVYEGTVLDATDLKINNLGSDQEVVSYENGTLHFLSPGNATISYNFDKNNPNAYGMINVESLQSENNMSEGLYIVNDLWQYFMDRDNCQKNQLDTFNVDYLNGSSLIVLYRDEEGLFTELKPQDLSLSRSDLVEIKIERMNIGGIMGDVIRITPKPNSYNLEPATLTYTTPNNKVLSMNIEVNEPWFFFTENGLVNSDYSNALTNISGQAGISKNITVYCGGKIIDASKIRTVDESIASYANGVITLNKDGFTELRCYFDDNNPEAYSGLPINVGDFGGGMMGDGTIFDYNGGKYQIGLGNIDTSQGGTPVLHIDGASGGIVSSEPFIVDLVLGIAELQNFDDNLQMVGIAPESFYNGVNNLTVAVKPDGSGVTATVTDKKMTELGVCAHYVHVEIPANTPFNGNLEVSVDLQLSEEDVMHFNFSYGFMISETINITGTLTKDDDLFTILSSRENFVSYCNKIGLSDEDINEDTYVTIDLGNNSYHGVLNIDISENENDIGGVLLMGHNTSFTGCVNVISGHPGFDDINFIADSDCKIKAADGTSYSVGIYARDSKHVFAWSDVSNVYGCSFTGYEYGVWGDKYGLVSGVRDATFNYCDIGICIDSLNHNRYSNYRNDKFVSCDKAVAILNYDQSTYQLSMAELEFYNNNENCIDFYVEHPGNYYFTGNYYAKEYTNSSLDYTNNNVRSANVVYKDGIVSELASNPCIRYPESNFMYGLDPLQGLYSKIPAGLELKINAADLIDLNSIIDLQYYDPKTQKVSGSLQFGGTN